MSDQQTDAAASSARPMDDVERAAQLVEGFAEAETGPTCELLDTIAAAIRERAWND